MSNTIKPTFNHQLTYGVGGYEMAMYYEFISQLEGDVTSTRNKSFSEKGLDLAISRVIKLIPEKHDRIFGNSYSCWIYYPTFVAAISATRNYVPQHIMDDPEYKQDLTISLIGDKDRIQEYFKVIDVELVKFEKAKVEWWYNSQDEGMCSKNITLDNIPKVESFLYPWFIKDNKQADIVEHVNGFLTSTSSILMLFGPPGTGKTSLLKQFIEKNDLTALICYEDVMLEHDEMFLSFLNRAGKTLLLVEDADMLISSRAEGNKLIPRFLNMADGIVSNKDKKIVFTSNITNYGAIDEALLRPGRCYDVIEFKYLSEKEANEIADQLKLSHVTGKDEYTLAEIFNQSTKTDTLKAKVGF